MQLLICIFYEAKPSAVKERKRQRKGNGCNLKREMGKK